MGAKAPQYPPGHPLHGRVVRHGEWFDERTAIARVLAAAARRAARRAFLARLLGRCRRWLGRS